MTPPYEERDECVTASLFMCVCGRSIGQVDQHNGRYRLKYNAGSFFMPIYWGTVRCHFCGREREFHGGLCSEMGDEPTTEMPPG